MKTRYLQPLLVLVLSLTVAACGFKLRGQADMPFDTLYVNVPPNSQLGAQLRRQIRTSDPSVQILNSAGEAEVQLQITNISRERLETSLNAQGRVQEYELTLRLTFELFDRYGDPLMAPVQLTTSRLLPWDDNVAQAKESEADQLFRAMQADLVYRIINRLDTPDLRLAIEASRASAGHISQVR